MNQNFDHFRVDVSQNGIAPKVVIVVPGLGAGGSEHVVSLVANHWLSRGFGVTILTLEPPGTKPYYELAPGISVVRIGIPPRRTSNVEAAWLVLQRIHRMRRTIGAIKPDFILSFLTRTNVLALLSTLGTGIPVIVSERNNPEAQPFGSGWKRLQEMLYPRAWGLVAMTTGAMEFFPQGMRRRSWVIPNAVDLPMGWEKRRGEKVVAAVGRLTHQKGFDILLEAFAKIEAFFPDWRLVIWGEGDDRGKLEERRRALGLEGRVEMPGVTAKPGQWVECADVFVLSSRYEGWGIVLLEAMAAGLPVVSFDCKWGPASMISHDEDGLLVPPEDPVALAEGLARLLSDEGLRARLSLRATETTKRYSKDRVLAQWDEVADSVLVRQRNEKAE
ncbi:MAG: glycosyltransferase family 4 protein [Rhizobium sp.]|nr:glycosyltransferase family 4 protein [Rhizobium sp.]